MNAGWRVVPEFDVEEPPILALAKCHTMSSKFQRNSLKTKEGRTFYSTHKSSSFEAQKHGRQ
jgi:hypothetical protein